MASGLALPAEAVALVERFVAADDASAAAVAVARGDGAIAAHACGRTHAASSAGAPGLDVDVCTPFDLASLTKPLATLTLLAGAVAAGRLALDDTLARWLPDAGATGDRTLEALLGHASGWPAWLDFAAASAAVADPLARAAAVRAAVLATAPEAAAGARAVYSDLGYMALGWVAEAVWAAPLDVALARLATPPLWPGGELLGYRRLGDGAGHGPVVALPAAAIVATEPWPRRHGDAAPLQGEVHDDNAAALAGVAGHAGLFASVLAVAAAALPWLRAVGRGQPGLDGALDPALARRLVTGAAAPETSWRLGWDSPSGPSSTAGAQASSATFGHLGFVGTSLWIDPKRDALVVLLTNRVHRGRQHTNGIRALRPALHDAVWRALD